MSIPSGAPIGVQSCQFHAQGSCPYGVNCSFKHDPGSQRAALLGMNSAETRARHRSPERYLQHSQTNFDFPVASTSRLPFSGPSELFHLEREDIPSDPWNNYWTDDGAEVQGPSHEIPPESAQTFQTVILGSIVTFGAGLDIRNIITGFESCTLYIRNLVPTVGPAELEALFARQGIDSSRFHIYALSKTSDGMQSAQIIADAACGRAMVAWLYANSEDGGLVSEPGAYDYHPRLHVALVDQHGYRSPGTLAIPTPTSFTITIPSEQYWAQWMLWNGLLGTLNNRKECNLTITEQIGGAMIHLSGSSKRDVCALKVRVEKLASGEKVDGWHEVFNTDGGAFARSLFEDTGAYVRADTRKQVMTVYGERVAIERARAYIKAKVDNLSILASTADESPGLDTSSNPEAKEFSCPVCCDSVSSPVQLPCGHSYCTACLRHFLVSALTSARYPIVCISDETRCGFPIPIPTISKFLSPASFDRLLETVFIAYVTKHPQEFIYCRTPDCTQIYRSTDPNTSIALQCPACFSTVCSSCGGDDHGGISCREHKALQDSLEQEFLSDVWISQQDGRVKRCPRCSVPIEKMGGCDHMACRCGAHVCWRCLGIYTASTIHAHLNQRHGNEPRRGNIRAVPEHFVDLETVDLQEQRRLLRQAQRRRRDQARRARARQ